MRNFILLSKHYNVLRKNTFLSKKTKPSNDLGSSWYCVLLQVHHVFLCLCKQRGERREGTPALREVLFSSRPNHEAKRG